MRTKLMIILLLLSACSKQLPETTLAFYVTTPHGTMGFTEATLSVGPFCDWNVYSISAGNSTNMLLISIPSDTLTKGTFKGGINYWGSFLFSDEISVTVTHYQPPLFQAYFKGLNCHGVISITGINSPGKLMNS